MKNEESKKELKQFEVKNKILKKQLKGQNNTMKIKKKLTSFSRIVAFCERELKKVLNFVAVLKT